MTLSVLFTPGPWQLLCLFFLSCTIMLFRLDAIEKKGFEGTSVGTLIMPYCSGFANLSFAIVMLSTNGNGNAVLENCIVNNVTNLTLILGIPAIFWGLTLSGKARKKKIDSKISYFSNLLTTIALLFFTAITWLLSRDGILSLQDGLVLSGLFVFWQVIHLFDVIKHNVIKKKVIRKSILLDLFVVGICAWGTYYSVEKGVHWITENQKGLPLMEHIGFISGLLMVLPNGVLAFYYAATRQSDIAYASQIGDCHICIPLCIGLFSIFSPLSVSHTAQMGIVLIGGAGAAHFIFSVLMGGLPRLIGATLMAGYAVFLYYGFQ